MTPAQFRKLALSMPDAVEGAHHGHADFRRDGRVFASLHPDGERAMVKVPLDEQRRLCASRGDAFSPAAGAWGRAGCTMVVLAEVDVRELAGAMTLAWQQVALAAAATRRPRRSTTAGRAKKPPTSPRRARDR